MQGAREVDVNRRDGSSIVNNKLDRPAMHVASRRVPRSTSSSAPGELQPRVSKDDTTGWVKTTSSNHTNSEEGLVGGLVELILILFEAVKSASSRHRSIISVRKVLQTRKRLKAWKDGKEQLDQKLGGAPEVRRLLVKTLTLLALVLGQGIECYHPERQSIKRQLIGRVDQAKALDDTLSPLELERYPSTDILEFLNARHQDFENRVHELYELSPEIDHLFQNFDGTGAGQNLEVREGERELGVSQQGLDRSCQSHNISVHPSQSLTVSRAIGVHRSLSDSANPSTEQSSGDTQSSQLPSLDLDDDDFDSLHQPADTNISDLTSPPGSSGVAVVSSSYLGAPGHRAVEAANSGHTESKDHSSHTHAHAQTHSPPTAVDGPIKDPRSTEIVDSNQPIKIWDSQGSKDKYSAKFDSGSSGDFITLSCVKKAGLEIYPIPNPENPYKMFNDHSLPVSGYAQPVWQFWISKEKKRRRDVRFFIVDELPDELDIVVGEKSMNQMGVYLRASTGALVAHRNYGKDKKGQGELKHAEQAHHGSASQTQRRKTLDEEHAIAKKSTHRSESQELHSQKDGAKQDNDRHPRS